MTTSAQEEFNELMRDKGSRSQHPEDDQDSTNAQPRDMATSSIAFPRSSMTSSRDRIPQLRYGANTGPKGVISDAQDFQAQKRLHRVTTQVSKTSLSIARPDETSESTFGQQLQTEKAAVAEEHGNDLDEEDDQLDEDFVAQWRQGRMQELSSGTRQHAGMQSATNGGWQHGGMTTVDGEGYLDAVEGSGPDAVVLVYIYDDMVSVRTCHRSGTDNLQSQVSQLFEKCLRTLSGKHEAVRFIKLHFADAEMEPAGVPALIAYRGGDKFAALVPIIDEMPEDGELDALTLEQVLQRWVHLCYRPSRKLTRYQVSDPDVTTRLFLFRDTHTMFFSRLFAYCQI